MYPIHQLNFALRKKLIYKLFSAYLQLGYDSSQLTWVEGDAQNLQFKDGTFDAYTIAFGIRNVVNIDQVRNTFCNNDIKDYIIVIIKIPNHYIF